MTTENFEDECTDLAKPDWKIAQDFARSQIERVFELPKDFLKGEKPISSFQDHCEREQQFMETVRKWIKDRWIL